MIINLTIGTRLIRITLPCICARYRNQTRLSLILWNDTFCHYNYSFLRLTAKQGHSDSVSTSTFDTWSKKAVFWHSLPSVSLALPPVSSTDPATNSEKRVFNFQINCIFLTKNPQRNLIYVQMKFFYLVKTSESNFCNWLVSKINILKSETFLVTWQIFIIVDDNFTTIHRQTVISSGKFTLRVYTC